MTLLNGCTVIVGSIIGSGIFVSPSGVLMQTGSINMAIMVWIISGVFSMVGAYCYAELGCMIKKTGADYAYIMVTFGPFMAFIRLWVECIIVRPCSQAIVALTFSIYACKPFFPECDPPDESVRLLAAICICKYFFLQMWYHNDIPLYQYLVLCLPFILLQWKTDFFYRCIYVYLGLFFKILFITLHISFIFCDNLRGSVRICLCRKRGTCTYND